MGEATSKHCYFFSQTSKTVSQNQHTLCWLEAIDRCRTILTHQGLYSFANIQSFSKVTRSSTGLVGTDCSSLGVSSLVLEI